MQSDFEKFYSDHLKEFGLTARGVGWKDEESQSIRFEQLLKVINGKGPFTINDLGCGVGDMVTFLNRKEFSYNYHGYDMLPQMIEHVRGRFIGHDNVKFSLINGGKDLESADYTTASGIFNIKFAQDDKVWLDYILDTLSGMNEKSRMGFSFNVLTKYSDEGLMRAELYYADPCFLFDYCKKYFARNVALLHDYELYDFTILVRKY